MVCRARINKNYPNRKIEQRVAPCKKNLVFYTHHTMGNTTRNKKTNKLELQEASKKKNEEFFARTGKAIGEAGRDKHAENIADHRD